MKLATRLDEIWYGGKETGLLPKTLKTLSYPYRLAIRMRELSYRAGLRKIRKLTVPCLAVGNIVVGGTGKTPTVSWIVGAYERMGLRPGIISRGYGGRYRGTMRVPKEGGAAAAAAFGDEPVLLAVRHPEVPVIVGRDRFQAGKTAVDEHGVEMVVADDAFQHFPLARDLDLVVVDARRRIGNGLLFPGGPLRESPLGLSRARIVLLNRISHADSPEFGRAFIEGLSPGCLLVEGEVEVSGWRLFQASGLQPVDRPPSGRVFAFCGLANPDVFHRSLAGAGVEVSDWRIFPDHYSFQRRDLTDLARRAESAGTRAVVTTEKDAVRLENWPGRLPLYVLTVQLTITSGESALLAMLASLAGRGKGRLAG